MKKAILTVSYGVRNIEEMRKSIMPVELAIERAFPEHRHFQAFACLDSVEILRQNGADVWRYTERLEYLRTEGYEDISVAALLLAPGVVYDALLKDTAPLRITTPLLDENRDLLRIGRIYGDIAAQTGREVVLMGHGSTSRGDVCYSRLSEALPEHVHLACRQGCLCLKDVVDRLKAGENRRILLMPLMLTAGRHARNEMAGDGPESWINILSSEGFEVEARLDGMGSLPEIQQLFVDKAKRLIV